MKRYTKEDLQVIKNHSNVEAAKMLNRTESCISSARNYYFNEGAAKRSKAIKKAWETRRNSNAPVQKNKPIDFIINGTKVNIDSNMLSKIAISSNAIKIDF